MSINKPKKKTIKFLNYATLQYRDTEQTLAIFENPFNFNLIGQIEKNMALPTSLANARLSRIVSRYSSWVGYYRKRGERKKGKKERKKRKKTKKVKRPSSRPHFLRKRRVPRIFHFERGKGWKSAQETAIILSPLYVARKTRNNAMEFLKDRPLSPADPQRPPFFLSFLHFHLFFLSFFLSFLFFFFFLIFFFSVALPFWDFPQRVSFPLFLLHLGRLTDRVGTRMESYSSKIQRNFLERGA